MARNSNKFTNVSTLDDDKNDKVTREIMDDADLKTVGGKGNGGRKPKEIKSDKLIRVYINSDQKKLLEAYCFRTGVTESSLVRQLLIEKEVF